MIIYEEEEFSVGRSSIIQYSVGVGAKYLELGQFHFSFSPGLILLANRYPQSKLLCILQSLI